VKSTTSSGLDVTPVPFRLNQSPLAAVLLRQAPTSIAFFRYRTMLCGQLGRARLSSTFAVSCPVHLTLRTHPRLMQASRHCFRSLCADVVRPRPRSARYPFPSGRESTPWPPSVQRQVPTAAPAQITRSRPFRLSADDFHRCVSGFRRQAFTSRFSGLRGPVLRLAATTPLAQVCKPPC